jgi:lactoylglutathione lyase
MNFAHVTIFVKDLERSLAFYHGVLELPIARRAPGANGPVFLGEEGKPVIELIGGKADPRFAGFSIGFEVPSLEEATRKLEASGVVKLRGPISPNPTVKFSFFSDPDGAEIQLVEYICG